MPKRVLAIFAGTSRIPGACEIYRVTIPLYTLGQKTGEWVTGWTWFSEIARDFERQGSAVILDLIARHDLFIFPRLFFEDEMSKELLAFLYSAIRANNKRIIYEVDDDYTNEHRVVIDGDALTPAKWADALTVTTPYLGEKMRQCTGRPAYVLPNCIAPSLWRDGTAPARTALTQHKLIVALTGSLTHLHDWQVLETVMPRILDEFPQVHFVVMGLHPAYLKGLPRSSYLPGAGYAAYTQVIRGSDIVLAPVEPADGFNASKSPIKAIEGQAAERLVDGLSGGAAVIATDNPVYRLAIQDGKTGLLTPHTPEGWYNALRMVIRDRALRTRLQRAGYQWVYKHHDITRQWRQWAAAYHAILTKPAHSYYPHTRYLRAAARSSPNPAVARTS